MPTPNKAIGEKVAQEHQHLEKEMAELKLIVMKEVSAEDFPNWRLELVWQLRDFKNLLLKHFDLEEEGGFMTDVLHEAPHSESLVQQLRSEHAELSLLIDDIMAQVKSMRQKSPAQSEQVRLALNNLVDMLRRHEEEEHRLLQRTYFREYGGPS